MTSHPHGKAGPADHARSVAEHLAAVTDLLARLAAESRAEVLPLTGALGRALVHGLLAPISLPPFDNSQMDGYAVRSVDISDGGADLRIMPPVPAGSSPQPLRPGTAAPIMTGAMIPAGADAVVPIEKAVPDHFRTEGSDGLVKLPATVPGTYVRTAGSDIAAGERAMAARTCLGPAQLGLLAALGMAEVEVYRAVTVLLVTTGDEVVQPGQPLPQGKIYDSNGTLLEAAMKQAGLNVRRTGISTDNPAELQALLRTAGHDVDLIVTTGGVSKGAYEVVRQAMADQPAEFLHVAMQPGGPQGIGLFDGVPFLGFPGNPVSCLVSFEMFLRPALSGLLGSPAARQPLRGRLAQPLESPGHKHQVRRGSLQRDGTVQLEGGEGSHLMHALAGSNCLVHVPVGVTELAAGDEVEVWML
ncbi:molybdopterin molybdotransferase MoeA [Pseudarthrobacter niigatensis]|uniref:Molybdopterin molybdenumtransferase n=1 Tax=Pseudarthrobacter niigatensis TaxID=369935 RepID=A0AAJ1SV77_9MICC|nr:gephyrin-like molybdotransferase Glp [Pseudarthrobacter niigatensis]MDQ0146423.1 molybdopterin molybdotransferase [Pseudarthrobacter niigatensis]MDQ0264973.1 molybdopterin molybdotransferase [Pseudarthrobacter niigatensis]